MRSFVPDTKSAPMDESGSQVAAPETAGTIEDQRPRRDRQAAGSPRRCSSRRGSGAGPRSIGPDQRRSRSERQSGVSAGARSNQQSTACRRFGDLAGARVERRLSSASTRSLAAIRLAPASARARVPRSAGLPRERSRCSPLRRSRTGDGLGDAGGHLSLAAWPGWPAFRRCSPPPGR